jgi:hypothetical protein
MKKYLLITSLLTMLSLASCGCNTASVAPSSKDTESSVIASVVEESSEDEESSEEESSSSLINYAVTVKKPDATPALNTKVVWCTATNCFRPVAVDETGKATFASSEETLYVHLSNLPENFAFNPNAYVETKDAPETTITLSEVEALNDNTISKTGVYSISVEDATTAINLTLGLADGTYNVESWVDYTAASVSLDLDPKATFGNAIDDNSGSGNNFSLDAEVKTGQDNVLSISANQKATFFIAVTAK